MRTAFAVLCSCVILSLAALMPAKAGEYYDGGYYRGGYYGDGYYRTGYYRDGYHRRSYYGGGYYRPYHRNVWYTSKCCYRKVIRHSAHYERIYRYGYYDRPYRYGYYGRPYRYGYYGGSYYRPAYYGNRYYYGDRHYYGDRYYGDGYDAYNAVSAGYADSCYRRRVPFPDGRGGWVWALKTNCY